MVEKAKNRSSTVQKKVNYGIIGKYKGKQVKGKDSEQQGRDQH